VAAIQAEQRLLGTPEASPGASLPLFFHFFFFCFQPLPQDGVMNTAEVRGWLCKRNLPQEMGHPRWERWELAGRETGRGIYHMTWDFQDGNYQVGKREEEFTTGDGTSLMGTGR